MSPDTLSDLPNGQNRWVPGPLVWIRGLRVLLWTLVLTGPALAVAALAQLDDLTHRVDEVSHNVEVEPSVDPGPAEGFAELFLEEYLSSGGDASAVMASPTTDEGSWRVLHTVSLGAVQTADGYFAVMVAVELAPGRDAAAESDSGGSSTLHYRLGVVDTPSGWTAIGPPALVAAPVGEPPPKLLVDRLDGLSHVVGLDETIDRFLSAYLTSDGELARYVAPGSHLMPVQPPPFITVEVLDAGAVALADGTRQVVAVVKGTHGSGRSQVLQYGLVVADRSGRWEVVELLPAPSVADTDEDRGKENE